MTTETGQKRSALEKVLLVWQGVVDMMLQGKRDPEEVLAHVQEIKDGTFRKKPVVNGPNVKANLREWSKFYKKFFGITLDTRKIKIPGPKEGFNLLIVLAKGLTNSQIYAKCSEHFPCWKYADNLDVVTSVRVNDETYAIWVRDRVEADGELKNRSADDLKVGNVNCITLPERLILELCYWSKTGGKHLDLQNITLCAGSRDWDGDVPGVAWNDGKLYVDCSYSYYRLVDLRARAAVV